jgi:hypothetical protein
MPRLILVAPPISVHARLRLLADVARRYEEAFLATRTAGTSRQAFWSGERASADTFQLSVHIDPECAEPMQTARSA